MARDTLTVNQIGGANAQYTADITPTDIVAANGLQVANNGSVLINVTNNGTSGAQTLTITSVACSHGRTDDISRAVAQGSSQTLGPFPPELWNDSSGNLLIDSATEDNFEFSAIRLPQ